MFGLKNVFTCVINQAWKSIENLNYMTVNYGKKTSNF